MRYNIHVINFFITGDNTMKNENLYWRNPVYTVKDYYEWKLKTTGSDSVENVNLEAASVLKWDRLDTLYSFQKIYQIGLQLPIYSEQLKEARTLTEGVISSRKTQYELSKYMNDLNIGIEKTGFLSVYFQLGNVIPIWPGGNQDKGAGYDFPETYFQDNLYWTQALLQKYNNACMDEILDNNIDVDKIKKDENAYFDYLATRRDIIVHRTKSLKILLQVID